MLVPVGEPVKLELPLPQSGVHAKAIAMKGFKGIGREIKVTVAHRVLAQQSIEVIYFRPYIAVVILQLQIVLSRGRQIDRDTSHTFRTAVFDAITDRGFQTHYLRQLLVRAERQTDMHAFVLVHLQDLFYMTDIHRCAGRNISRRSNRRYPFRRPYERQRVQCIERRVGFVSKRSVTIERLCRAH